jgi:hypothetical protein
MSKGNWIAMFKKMTDFNEMLMSRIPSQAERESREATLLDIRNCLIADNVTGVDYEAQLRRLTELLETFVTLNAHHPELRENFQSYDVKFDNFVLQMKHVILTVRVQIMLLELCER